MPRRFVETPDGKLALFSTRAPFVIAGGMPSEAERIANRERIVAKQIKGQIPSAERKTGTLKVDKARKPVDKARQT